MCCQHLALRKSQVLQQSGASGGPRGHFPEWPSPQALGKGLPDPRSDRASAQVPAAGPALVIPPFHVSKHNPSCSRGSHFCPFSIISYGLGSRSPPGWDQSEVCFHLVPPCPWGRKPRARKASPRPQGSVALGAWEAGCCPLLRLLFAGRPLLPFQSWSGFRLLTAVSHLV